MVLGNENSKKTRTGKPKVRTGCQTCKTRRVKCGEEKPCCLRCSRSGFKCDGYQSTSFEKTPRKKLPSLLIPKFRRSQIKSAEPFGHSSISDRTVITFTPNSAYDSFELSQKDLYLGLTPSSSSSLSPGESRQTLEPLSGNSFTSPFSPYSNDYGCVAPHRVTTLPRSNNETPYTPQANNFLFCIPSQCHETYSKNQKYSFKSPESKLSYQNSADNCLLYREVDGLKFEIHCTFFTCLLFQIFENSDLYRDEWETKKLSTSLIQVTAGLRQIRDWVAANSQAIKSIPESNNLSLCQNFRETNCWDESDRANIILKNLESHVAIIAELRAKENNVFFWRLSQEAAQRIPQIWSTLDEARKNLVEIVERNQRWLRTTMYLNFVEDRKQFSLPIRSFCSSLVPRLVHPDIYLSLSSKAKERAQILDELSRWNYAFQPLLNASHLTCASQSNFIMASILRMQWLANWIICADENIGADSININKEKLNEFGELFDIADILLKEWLSHQHHKTKVEGMQKCCDTSHQEEYSQFYFGDENNYWFMQYWLFNLPFLSPLITIAWLYRHRPLRTLTSKLLNCCPDQDTNVKEGKNKQNLIIFRKNGLNRQIMAKVLAWLFLIEEESWRLGSTITTTDTNITGTSTKIPIFSSNNYTDCKILEDGSVEHCICSNISSTKLDNGGSDDASTEIKSDYIPDWARARQVSMSYDDGDGKGVKVGCLQAVGYLGSAMGQWRDILIPW